MSTETASKYLKLKHTYLHYREKGTGEPVLFLHGNPSSSYIWRNIFPYISSDKRCIAPDLMGMGESGKPNGTYSFQEHYTYLEQFIGQLGINGFHLVLHDWGSALGFHFAMNFPERIKSMAFMESMVKPWKWKELRWDYRLGFGGLRTPVIGEILVYGFNAFFTLIMPRLIYRKLTKKEIQQYKLPFQKIKDRKPMLTWSREIPINGNPNELFEKVQKYSLFLQESPIPKLLLYGKPGAIIREKEVKWCLSNMRNLESKYVGPGLHFLQEDQPEAIGQALRKWLTNTP